MPTFRERQRQRPHVAHLARELALLGFRIIATGGTREFLVKHGIDAELVWKVHEARPNIIDHMINGEVALAINTPFGKSAFIDDTYIPHGAATQHSVHHYAHRGDGVRGRDPLAEGRGSTFAALQEQHDR